MIISKHKQGTDEWHFDRQGCITASESNIINIVLNHDNKSATYKTFRDYVRDKAIDRIKRQKNEIVIPPPINSVHIQRGTEHEHLARMSYENKFNIDVTEIGFCKHKTIPNFGCSPDGIFNHEDKYGILEIKCPTRANHYKLIEDSVIEPNRIIQMDIQLIVTGALFCDYVSFNLDAVKGQELYVKRHWRHKELDHCTDAILWLNDCIKDKVAELKQIPEEQLTWII